MASLYELDQRMITFINEGVDTETGEVATSEEDLQRMFDEINMDLKTKMINMACYIKSLKGDIEQYDKEIERLQKKRKTLANQAQRYSDLLDFVAKHQINNVDDDFEATNKWKIDDPKATISYRRSEKVEVVDANIIPKSYMTKKVELKPDLTAIKEAIKAGKKVKGATIVQNLSLQIK